MLYGYTHQALRLAFRVCMLSSVCVRVCVCARARARHRSARACTPSVSLWRLRSRSCEHARACVQILGKCVQESERKGLRRKGERTSCRVAARGAARALRSACGAGTHTDSQRGLRYKTCAQLPKPASEPMDTHIKRLSLHICMLCAILNCILFHCLLHYIYTYRYHVDR